MKTSDFAVRDAISHSYLRKNKLPKKITPEIARSQIELAQLTGEASGAERMLALLLKHKAGPDFKVEDFEADLHIFVSDVLQHVSKGYYGVKMCSLENVLSAHGYTKEKVCQPTV